MRYARGKSTSSSGGGSGDSSIVIRPRGSKTLLLRGRREDGRFDESTEMESREERREMGSRIVTDETESPRTYFGANDPPEESVTPAVPKSVLAFLVAMFIVIPLIMLGWLIASGGPEVEPRPKAGDVDTLTH
jgi:hypothetical protein